MDRYASWVRIDGESFRRSSFSEGGGDCVEAAKVEGIAVRDSKAPDGPTLWFTVQEWAAFLLGVVAGEFDF
ncbi:hypothetical protein GCM10009555_097310 [Acrocarpospora macrocephala]|uniref:DUF397 domain-containing protein n=1 Tax=Acrocarpospora macrocephala TaxID=150177 RepID=A0A5M3XB42_9ACTN|nr:DUF397 domain-containing protein [Acrocarpospora macrocephala]GES16721.1 hypothetical protein Amac_103190 [Acrocarpospora macrocephala]